MAVVAPAHRDQTKTVAVLIVMLAAALIVLAYRLRPNDAGPRVPSRAVAQVPGISNNRTKDESSHAVGFNAVTLRSRNPFAAPSRVQGAGSERAAGNVNVRPIPVGMVYGSERGSLWSQKNLPNIVAVKTAAPQSVPASEGKEDLANDRLQNVEDEPAKCTLLATVAGDRGCVAVIQFEDSKVETVQVGDVLDSGFRVVSLNRDEAVLTNGKRTIVARRPR